MLSKRHVLYSSVLIVIALALILIPNISNAENTPGVNYRNTTIPTKVTISNSNPEILELSIHQEMNASLYNVTLNAGSLRNITCNATIRDWDGYPDIQNVNATLWDVTTSSRLADDDNNSHYSVDCTDLGNGVNFTVNYLCVFPVYYYANNGSWNCSVEASDHFNKTGNLSNTTTIYPLYALNVTDGIDYGQVAVDDDSLTQTANVTNFGNMPINLSVEGYAVTRGDGLAMNCSINGNITIGYEHFSTSDTGLWVDKNALTGSAQPVPDLTISKQTAPSIQMTNTTYWQLRVPPNPAGNCSGFVIFQAETP